MEWTSGHFSFGFGRAGREISFWKRRGFGLYLKLFLLLRVNLAESLFTELLFGLAHTQIFRCLQNGTSLTTFSRCEPGASAQRSHTAFPAEPATPVPVRGLKRGWFCTRACEQGQGEGLAACRAVLGEKIPSLQIWGGAAEEGGKRSRCCRSQLHPCANTTMGRARNPP